MINLTSSKSIHRIVAGYFPKKALSRSIPLLSALAGIVLPAVSHADEDGRYRAIVLHQGGSYSQSAALSPKVFILDSRDGHMWTWEQNAQMKNAQGNLTFGTMTVYQGKLKVGRHIGEVVDQSR